MAFGRGNIGQFIYKSSHLHNLVNSVLPYYVLSHIFLLVRMFKDCSLHVPL